MKRPFDEELISAYLDGELTAAEQARVEEALRGDAALRHLHDDLRSLRSGLQSLPREKLDSGFVERVLRAAQTAQRGPVDQPASNNHPPAASSPVAAPHVASPPVAAPVQPPLAAERAGGREPLVWRAVVISVATLAAAIVIALALPGRFDQVALHTVPEKPGQENLAAQPATAATEKAAALQTLPEHEPDGVEAQAARRMVENSAEFRQELHREELHSQIQGSTAKARKQSDAKQAAESKSHDPNAGREAAESGSIAGGSAEGARGGAMPASDAMPATDEVPRAAIAPRAAFSMQRQAAPALQANESTLQLESLDELRPLLERSAAQQQDRQLAHTRDLAADKLAREQPDAQHLASETPIVVVRLTSALDADEVDRVLARQNIQLAEANSALAKKQPNQVAGALESDTAKDAPADNSAESAVAPRNQAQAEAANGFEGEFAENTPARERALKRTLPTIDLEPYADAADVMFVEAEPAQIEALVQALAAREPGAQVSVRLIPTAFEPARVPFERSKSATPKLEALAEPSADVAPAAVAPSALAPPVAEAARPAPRALREEQDAPLKHAPPSHGYAERLERKRDQKEAEFAAPAAIDRARSFNQRPPPAVVPAENGAAADAPAGFGAAGGGGISAPGISAAKPKKIQQFAAPAASTPKVRVLLVIERPQPAQPIAPAAPSK
jgi:hypothetical protein